MKKFELLPLPYSRTAFEPFLSEESFRYHYDAHHRGYIDKLNELIPGTELEDLDLEQILWKSSGAIFNNAAQAWNHDFYWRSFTPSKNSPDSSPLLSCIKNSFNSMNAFIGEFKALGSAHFGSGWLWLTYDGDKLHLETSANAENPMLLGRQPILVCDLWEHAYYIDYRNRRAEFLAEFAEHLNWSFAAINFTSLRPQAISMPLGA